MGRKWIAIAILISAMVLVSLLIIALHQGAKHEVLFRYQEHRLAHARHVARQIETYLDNISLTLKTFTSTPAPKRNEIQGLKTKILASFHRIDKPYNV